MRPSTCIAVRSGAAGRLAISHVHSASPRRIAQAVHTTRHAIVMKVVNADGDPEEEVRRVFFIFRVVKKCGDHFAN